MSLEDTPSSGMECWSLFLHGTVRCFTPCIWSILLSLVKVLNATNQSGCLLQWLGPRKLMFMDTVRCVFYWIILKNAISVSDIYLELVWVLRRLSSNLNICLFRALTSNRNRWLNMPLQCVLRKIWNWLVHTYRRPLLKRQFLKWTNISKP